MGNNSQAIELFQSYLSRTFGDHEAKMEYAGILVREGHLDSALRALEELREDQPGDAETRRRLADVLIMGGEYWSAIANLEEIVRHHPYEIQDAATLCRTYAWVRDFDRAAHVYDSYLGSLDPNSPEDQTLLAPVLLDLQRPEEALGYLSELRQRHPQQLIWAAHLVRCHAMLAMENRAEELVAEMEFIEPEAIAVRSQLVEHLLLAKSYKLAMRVNEQILALGPEDPVAHLTAAKLMLAAYDTGSARSNLEGLDSSMAGMRSYELTLARFHELEGSWVESQSIYERMLSERPQDHETRISLSRLRLLKGDVERAKAEARKVVEESPLHSKARIQLANCLMEQRRADEAVSVCQAVLTEEPNNLEAILALARAQQLSGALPQARATCQRYIDRHSGDDVGIAHVRLALARTYVLEGNTVLASREYKAAMDHPSARTAAAYYGLANAQRLGGTGARSDLTIMSSLSQDSGEDLRLRIEFAGIALSEHDDVRASQYLQNILSWEPESTIAMVMLGEAQTLALKRGLDADPVTLFTRVLARAPDNTRARIGLARAHAALREYDEAISHYDILIAQDSSSTKFQRERARTLFWDHQFEEALDAYDALLDSLPLDAVAVDVYGNQPMGMGARNQMDYEAELEVAQVVGLERDAKMYMDWRPQLAIEKLDNLLAIEPGNTEAAFDLAQLRHRLGWTEDAVEGYDALLDIVSFHPEAEIARAGAQRTLRPRMEILFGNRDRKGRDGLALMEESAMIGDVIFPMGDERDYVGAGYGWRTYDSTTGASETASVLRLRGSKQLGKRTWADMVVEYPTYDRDDLFSSRLFFDGGLHYRSPSELGVDFTVFGQPVAHNEETMIRDLHRLGARLGISQKLSPKIDLGGSRMFADYSDNNTEYNLNAFASYELSPAPYNLKLMAKADFVDFSDPFDEEFEAGDPLSGLDTPYFAPSGYSVYSLELDWKHSLGEEWFTGAPDLWYGTSARVALDSNAASYGEIRAAAGYDVSDWLGFRIEASALRSDEIDITDIAGLVQLRWP